MERNWKNILINILKYLVMALLIVVIVANFYLGINKASSDNKMPSVFGVTPLIVMSGSMEPTIMPGDLVVIREQKASEYKVGDIASYLDGNITYTHRIVEKEQERFVLKGDNNNTKDEEITATQMVGKMILRIPKLGHLILFIKTLPGMMLTLVLLLIFIYGEEILAKIAGRNG